MPIDPANFFQEGSSSSSSSEGSSSSSIAEVPVDGQLRIAAAESVARRRGQGVVYPAGASYDETGPAVRFRLPAEVRDCAQILDVQVGVFDRGGVLQQSEQIFVWVERSMFAEEARRAGGPPMLQDLRARIRDSAPEDNHLLRVEEYDLAEVCLACVDALHAYNSARPPVKNYHSGQNWFDDMFLDGVLANLYQMSWEHRLRNRLPYAASGVTVDDHAAWDAYLKLAQAHRQLFDAAVRKDKKAINMGLGWTANGMLGRRAW